VPDVHPFLREVLFELSASKASSPLQFLQSEAIQRGSPMLIRDGAPSQNEMALRPPFGRVASSPATFGYLFGSKLLAVAISVTEQTPHQRAMGPG
jgi:hypothetical protein